MAALSPQLAPGRASGVSSGRRHVLGPGASIRLFHGGDACPENKQSGGNWTCRLEAHGTLAEGLRKGPEGRRRRKETRWVHVPGAPPLSGHRLPLFSPGALSLKCCPWLPAGLASAGSGPFPPPGLLPVLPDLSGPRRGARARLSPAEERGEDSRQSLTQEAPACRS